MNNPKSAQFLPFLVAGGIAAIANFGSRIFFSHFMAYVPAIIFAYIVGMATAFVLNRRFVFRANNPIHQQAIWFVLINLIALLQTLLISVLLERWAFPAIRMEFHPESISHAIGVMAPVLTSYLGHKHLTFRKNDPT